MLRIQTIAYNEKLKIMSLYKNINTRLQNDKMGMNKTQSHPYPLKSN